NAKSLLVSRFFDPKRYDLAHVGRYKMNKKLHIKNRLFNQVLAETVVDPETGEVLAQRGDKIDRKLLDRLMPFLENEEEKLGEKVLTPQDGVLDEEIGLQSVKIIDPSDPDGERELTVIGNGAVDKKIKNITPADILASISYFFNLLHQVGDTDDIDHLGN